MSSYHFIRLFKQSTGLTPHQYLRRCRIERAEKLLAKQDLPIAQICQQAGFRSPSRFSTVFRKHIGMSPKAYREQ